MVSTSYSVIPINISYLLGVRFMCPFDSVLVCPLTSQFVRALPALSCSSISALLLGSESQELLSMRTFSASTRGQCNLCMHMPLENRSVLLSKILLAYASPYVIHNVECVAMHAASKHFKTRKCDILCYRMPARVPVRHMAHVWIYQYTLIMTMITP